MTYVDFFLELGFDFEENLKSKVVVESTELFSEKLENNIFYYKSPNNTNTSFYLITEKLNEEELGSFRKYVWNRNDADLIFYHSDKENEVEMIYAKYSPKISNKDSVLDRFSTTEKDLEKLERIKHWQFDSGAFWLNYHSFIDKTKYKGIDKELVSVLKSLKEELDNTLSISISNEDERSKTVQALIDRTLYIKYLEDNHIINSYFFQHYFNDEDLNYEKLLRNQTNNEINHLYHIIHKIFNNNLFEEPHIDEKYLTGTVRTLIANSFNHDVSKGQLRLFDFKFDILPVEFISYVYEVFLSEKQKENGIYYTPKKLAQLIVDDVIHKEEIGSILDPSCGSGMFLIVGFQRLLEIAQSKNLEPKESVEKIKYRMQLLSENIFGIEKELTAQRFAIFSLSLQVFSGINPTDIKEFIVKELKENNEVNLFGEHNFYNNILCQNTLDEKNKAFSDKKFKYIVGNPPFFEIPKTENEYQIERDFLKTYKIVIDEIEQQAGTIVGSSQISQCFFLKIKEWSNTDTRFGFVSNSSNFYNDRSEKFQQFFYSQYGIEKIYELSKVKRILFENADESVSAIVFSNHLENSIIDYYSVDLGLLSEKPFELLIIQEDKAIEIEQEKLKNRHLRLRYFLVGNEYDLEIYEKLKEYKKISDFVAYKNNKPFIHEGLKIVGENAIRKEYNITKKEWQNFNRGEQLNYFVRFKKENISDSISQLFLYEYIKPENLNNFIISKPSHYLKEDVSNFERPRNPEIFSGNKIIFNRTGGLLKAYHSKQKIYFNFDLHCIRLKQENLYDFFTAILNSHLINYYIGLFLRKRIKESFPKVGNDDILNIPIPRELDDFLCSEISEISKDLSDGKFQYSEKEEELNELIYDLYDLSYWERQRIKDYFIKKEKIGRKKNALEEYKKTLEKMIGFYVETPLVIEETSTDFGLIAVKIAFPNEKSDNPKADKTKAFLLNEIFEQNPTENILASQEKIFGKDVVYIIKKATNDNWTKTKAFEDSQEILKHLIPDENGERVY